MKPVERSFIYVQPHMKFGGAENQTVLTVNRLVELGNECHLILHKKTGGFLDEVDPRVRIHELGFQNHLLIPFGALKLLPILRSIRPSLVITKLWSSILLVGLASRLNLKHRYRYYEDLDPGDHEQFISAGKLKKFLIGKVFQSNPGNLIANTHHVSLSMQKEYGLKEVPNVISCGIDRDRIIQRSNCFVELPARSGAIRIVSIGSLVPRKGLLELRAMLEDTKLKIEWLIVGEGPLIDELAKPLAKDSALDIYLVGSSPNPYPYLKNSDMLLHGGLSESFGVVLIEALMLGKPVIAHSSNGPIEIKRVTNSPMLYVGDLHFGDNLFKMISEFADSKFLDSSLNSVTSKYELSKVVDAWQREYDDAFETPTSE